MTGTESTREQWRREAYELGKQAAENAASWMIEPGRCDVVAVRQTLQLMRDGDPRADEFLPARPNLSGEWADDLTPARLADQIVGTDELNILAIQDELADEYERGVAEHFEAACERELIRYAS